MRPQITPAQKHKNLQLPTEEYMFVCIYIYIYIYIYIHTNQLIRRLFVDLIPNFPNQYQKN